MNLKRRRIIFTRSRNTEMYHWRSYIVHFNKEKVFIPKCQPSPFSREACYKKLTKYQCRTIENIFPTMCASKMGRRFSELIQAFSKAVIKGHEEWLKQQKRKTLSETWKIGIRRNHGKYHNCLVEETEGMTLSPRHLQSLHLKTKIDHVLR